MTDTKNWAKLIVFAESKLSLLACGYEMCREAQLWFQDEASYTNFFIKINQIIKVAKVVFVKLARA